MMSSVPSAFSVSVTVAMVALTAPTCRSRRASVSRDAAESSAPITPWRAVWRLATRQSEREAAKPPVVDGSHSQSQW